MPRGVKFSVKRQSGSTCGETLSTTQMDDSTYVVQQEPEASSGPGITGLLEYGADPDADDDRLIRTETGRRFEEIDLLIDPDSFAIGLTLTTEGVILGTFYGSLRDTITIEVKTENISGNTKFFLRNGNEVWHAVNLTSSSPKATLDEVYKVFAI
ncbi:uncharacterized protein RCC_08364 [Ramularia collo-cygni]|uniref:Uncharacterized protein n=1 Tax=Ramularia collo-cygni TaxID=112498 RepID=A0A2D3VHM8_9PEZI|nr:uncharacterized protein RCC_08364 [Ramularia collo-cygni]CZT22659.1 uncharacterized protein RCC_08364 [Ramularia collo-cygni]